MSNRETQDACPGEASTQTMTVQAYAAWLASVARFLGGFGFLDPTAHMMTCGHYLATAYGLGMMAQRCARNIARAHEEKRSLPGQKGSPSGVV
jgi:hypothetical protein